MIEHHDHQKHGRKGFVSSGIQEDRAGSEGRNREAMRAAAYHLALLSFIELFPGTALPTGAGPLLVHH